MIRYILFTFAITFFIAGAAIAATEGLVLFLSFDDEDIVDQSQQPTNVTVHGNLQLAEGKIGQAFDFDGATFLEVDHAEKLEGMDGLTIEAWVFPRATGNMCIVAKREATQVNEVYTLFTRPAIEGRINYDGVTKLRSDALQENTWYHIAFVFDGVAPEAERMKLYLDGILVVTQSHPDTKVAQGGAPLWVGELDANRGYLWNGLIDELGIWERALSAPEIAQLYNGGNGITYVPSP